MQLIVLNTSKDRGQRTFKKKISKNSVIAIISDQDFGFGVLIWFSHLKFRRSSSS